MHATDPETISTVKVQVSINDDQFSQGELLNLSHIGNNIFELSTIIETSQEGADLVYWRLMSTDLQNNVQLFPNPPSYYWYSDPLDCAPPELTPTPTLTPLNSQTPTITPTQTSTPEESETPDGNTPTQTPTPTATGTEVLSNAVFSNPIGPKDVVIVNCLNTYSVEVIDPEGIDTVSLQYAVNDETFSFSDSIELTYQGVNLYGDILQLDTSTNPGSDVTTGGRPSYAGV